MKQKLLTGMQVGGKTFKVHLDGYNITDALAGKSPSPRHEFFYFNDDGSLVALRFDQWKLVFAEQRGRRAWTSGRIPSCRCACPSCSTFARTPSKPPTMKAWTTTVWRMEHIFLTRPCASSTFGTIPGDVQGVPAQPEARKLQPRRGDGVAPERCARLGLA